VQKAEGPAQGVLPPIRDQSAPATQDTSSRDLPDGETRATEAANRRAGRTLTLLVGVLAFLLASSVARNSDVWMHLARGRMLAHGESSFGTDPPLRPGSPANASWLYDLISYGLYSAFGGTGLVLCKALLAAALGVLLVRLSRVGQGRWIAVFCTALALLAMSMRFALQPAAVSYFFLALALWFLRERENVPGTSFSPLRLSWPLLPLFVLWVNMDGWFVLGLGVVALVWLGRFLDLAKHADDENNSSFSPLVRLLISVTLLAAVCLLNPVHVAAFALPPELKALLPAASTAHEGIGQVTSPFQHAYLGNLWQVPAAVAYFPLLGLSLLSFVLNLPRWHWQRFLPWLGLALLSAVQVRTIPFFAIVAGPVMAWNIQDYFARSSGMERWAKPGWRRAISLGHILTGMLLLVLLVCAWPGWLLTPPFEPRRWAVETPSSLEYGAAAARDWLHESKLGEARGLHLSQETVNAFAWFCPEEKGVFDDSLASAIRGDKGAIGDGKDRMRAAGITHAIVYDTNRDRFFRALGKLLEDPRQWPLLYVKGNLAIFGWRDPDAKGVVDPFRAWELDANRLAFHPAPDKKAPGKSVDPEAVTRRWWEAFWKPFPPRSVDQDEATLHLFHADILRRSAPARHAVAWESCQTAALLAAAGGWAGPTSLIDADMRLTFIRPQVPQTNQGFAGLSVLDRTAYLLPQRFFYERDDTSPALLYLAVRAARRALAAQPENGQAYLVLGQSYLRLLDSTRERIWTGQLPELLHLRRCQAVNALNQAVALRPDLIQAHLSLSRLYGEMGFFDLALNHLRAYVRGLREAGPPPGVSAEQYSDMGAPLQKELDQLAHEVEKRNNNFVVASAGWKVGDRAMKAWQEGLGGTARDLLLESDISAFGPRGMAMELELLLRTGRPKDVRDWMGPEMKSDLGTSYHWMRTQALAALGEYDLAREECNEFSGSLGAPRSGRATVPYREIMALLVGQRVLGEHFSTSALSDGFWKTAGRMHFRNRVGEFAKALKREADLTVLRGLLALEQGDVEEAEIAFREALSVWKDADAAASGGGLDFNGRAIAQACLEWLK
jgi:tetratricopeptide (TPR) repeat protein